MVRAVPGRGADARRRRARPRRRTDVAFLGIDSRDPSKAAAQAFVRAFDDPLPQHLRPAAAARCWPSAGTLTPNSIPSTVVIDKQGRVAASVLGEITRTTLDDLVEDATSAEVAS